MNDKVSVIVPVYNVEKYIGRCIESIIKQSYKNLEIILIDDGSKDNSGKICDEYAQKDNRIKVIHKKNGGLSDARNTGLNIVNGEYICFIDSDDYIHKDLLKDNLEKLIQQKADMICFNRFVVNGEKIIEKPQLYNENMTTYDVISGIWKKKLSNVVWDKLYKKSLWENVRFVKGQIFEDLYAMPYILENVNKIICNNQAYYYYERGNVSSISHNVGMKFYILEFVGACIKIKVAKDKWQDLYQYSIDKAYEYGFQAYQYNIFTKYLSDEQNKKIQEFFRGGHGCVPTEVKYRIFLWDFHHGNIINKIKGFFYYWKSKKNGWIE